MCTKKIDHTHKYIHIFECTHAYISLVSVDHEIVAVTIDISMLTDIYLLPLKRIAPYIHIINPINVTAIIKALVD
jgi:hypothetical protein